MCRGYPVGELMFWENQDGDHTRTIGGDTKTRAASMQVVEGQQRLTSLYAVAKDLNVWRGDYSRVRIVMREIDLSRLKIGQAHVTQPSELGRFPARAGARRLSGRAT